MSLTNTAHQAVLQHLEAIDKTLLSNSVDATCGNGHDTLFLLSITEQLVFGFDVQATAIEQTTKRAKKSAINSTDNTSRLMLINESHANMKNAIHSSNPLIKIDTVMFNLGYLPRADKQITTSASSTIAALNDALNLLSNVGIMTIICYRGHAGGMQEATQVIHWLETHQSHGVISYQEEASVNANDTTPVLFIVKSLKQ